MAEPVKRFVRQARLPRGAYTPDLGKALSPYAKVESKRWCKNHPLAFWGKHPNGAYYPKCVRGFKSGEECKEGGS